MVMKTTSDSNIEAGRQLAKADEGEEVVISGLSGVYPDSDNVVDFASKLFNKVDLISEDDRRWKLEHPDIPQRTGKLSTVHKFDGAFFGMHYNQAHSMDPMCRIFIEKAYEAVIDSGYNPCTLRGSRTGVFVGACFSESEKTWFFEKLQASGFAITGSCRSMMANRVTYWLGVNGPSFTVDTACSSSMYAFDLGYKAVRQGHCDAAIIGGCNLCLHPFVSLQFSRLGVLSPDGKCKSFDERANGYCRSEAVCAVYLQKKKDARRIYATVVHAKTNCDGFKDQGITYPSGEIQQCLLNDFYAECQVNPATLHWIEAHGTGTKVGDPEEVKALYNVFCNGREGTLQIGSVKSNIGHSEPASGLCSITKVIIAMESGVIPPNINFETPRSDIEVLKNGTIKVVTEPTKWDGSLVGVNSFGFGGANCHTLLEWNKKSKVNGGLPQDNIPRLVAVSGRNEAGVEKMLDDLLSRPLDSEYIKLYHDIFKDEILGYVWRGFEILGKHKMVASRQIQYCGQKQPLILLLPGHYGSWAKLDRSFLLFPQVTEILNKLSKALEMDVLNLVFEGKHGKEDNLINNIVATTAIQIVLIDLLKMIEIDVDKYVGIANGEIACAYADGCLTAEEAILVAYYSAAALSESLSESYASARIGMRSSHVQHLCSDDVEVQHINGKKCIVAGPKSALDSLFKTLKKEKNPPQISYCEFPLNSLHATKATSRVSSYLQKVLKEKRNTTKWTDPGKKCSCEYLSKVMTEPVAYEALLKSVRSYGTLCEVGPRGVHDLTGLIDPISPFSGEDSSCISFLGTLGRLYLNGHDMALDKLYPPVSYPVSRSTPMISPLIEWDHSEDWYVGLYNLQGKLQGEKAFSVSYNDNEEYEYISGHVIDGRNLYPATGYLSLVWEAFASLRGGLYTDLDVVFENVVFHRATNISKDGNVDFIVVIKRMNGEFEVVEGGAPIVTGTVHTPKDVKLEISSLSSEVEGSDFPMSSKDIYKEFRLRGYNYKGLFRSLVAANSETKTGLIQWQQNWVAFMDNMLQMQIVFQDTRGLFVPTSINKVVIDTKQHKKFLEKYKPDNKIPVQVHHDVDVIRSGGIEIRGLKANAIARRKVMSEAVLEKYLFVPNETEKEEYALDLLVRIMVQTILENEPMNKVKVVEFEPKRKILSPQIATVLGDLPLIQPEITVHCSTDDPLVNGIGQEISVEDKKMPTDQSALIVVGNDLFDGTKSQILQLCSGALKDGGFIITRENLNSSVQSDLFTIVAQHTCDGEKVVLLRKSPTKNLSETKIVKFSNDCKTWLPQAQELMKTNAKDIVFVGEKEKLNGILGFVNCLRKEPDGTRVRCVFVMDDDAPSFSVSDPLFLQQLEKNLAINVYQKGKWGTYRHLLMDTSSTVLSPHIYANVATRGDLSSLTWYQGRLSTENVTDRGIGVANIECLALNFRDIMLGTGKIAPEVVAHGRINQDCVLGFEYSGNYQGRRVFGIAPWQGLASRVEMDPTLIWNIPDEWSYEDAATVPVVFCTAAYAMYMSAKMKKGESILIHSGTGGVGQAAIHLALHEGLTVFTTVGTQEKREFLLRTFPQLNERNIGNSRDTSFETLIMQETNGRGVDIVLNSLAEEKLIATARCLAKCGRFCEIGKFDISKNNPLNMELFKKGASFHGIMLDNLMDASKAPGGVNYRVQNLLTQKIKDGAVRPLCRTIFERDQLETAFRYMGSGKHVGKVLIRMKNESVDPITNTKLYAAKPRYYCNPKKTYIVTGGLGGCGLELADWLVLREARKLVITSRKGVTNGYQRLRINLWQSYGAQVKVLTHDITTEEGAKQLLIEASEMGPVGGIFNLAVVLKDALFENQTVEDFETSLSPKAIATLHLDKHSRLLCPELEQFVVFSSVSCGRGNAGQTNYGMSNSIMERTCEDRGRCGLPGLAVQWGAVGDVGLVAEMQDEQIEIVIGGTLQQRISSCLEVMDGFLTQKDVNIVSSMVVAEKKAGSSSSDDIVGTVVNILGLRDLKTVSLHSTLAELGMDSMMAVEIKQTLEREFEVFLSPQDIRGLTFAKLYELSPSTGPSDVTVTANGDGVIEHIECTPDDMNLFLFLAVLGDEPAKFETMVELPSLGPQNKSKKTVFMIPGIEGMAAVLEPLSRQTVWNVRCLQLDYNANHGSIAEIANSLLPYVKESLKEQPQFHIVGYSFGGLIAMELVLELEKLGYSGKLCLVDSSPAYMKRFTDFATSNDNLTELILLSRVLECILPLKQKSIMAGVSKIKGWDARLDYAYKGVDEAKYSRKFLAKMVTAILSRIYANVKYQGIPEKSLSSPTILVRAKDASTTNIEEDYDIQKYFKDPVELHIMEGNHLSMLQNPKVAEVVNTMLMTSTTEHPKTQSVETTKLLSHGLQGVKNI